MEVDEVGRGVGSLEEKKKKKLPRTDWVKDDEKAEEAGCVESAKCE